MLDVDTIRQMSKEQAKKAARAHKEPFMWGDDCTFEDLRGIPNIGDYRPKGWELVDQYFVDKTGIGYEDEPALTTNQLLAKMKPGMGYAIIEEGEFQIYVGEFKKVEGGHHA